MREWPLKVVVAGGGRGIGAACARELAFRGDEVVVCARTAAEVEGVARETRGRAVVADLATDEGAALLASHSGGAELALICAGAAHPPLHAVNVTRALLLEQLAQNTIAPVLAGTALARAGVKHLVFLSTLATKRPPIEGAAPYTAAKSALESLVRALAEEGWPRLRANALCLGPVRTRAHEIAGTPREWLEQFLTPEEIAPTILAFAGEPRISGRIVDADAYARDPAAALQGVDFLAQVDPLPAPGVEAEPGRRPSVRVRTAVRTTAATLHRYPRGAADLQERLAALHGVTEDCIALSGGGASELLERCLRAFCAPGDEVVSPFPTFEMLSAFCSRQGVRHKPVLAPRRPDGLYAPHAAAPLLAAVGPRTRLVYVASPDNPTGAALPAAEEQKLAAFGVPLVLDEAWSLDVPAPVPHGALRLRSLSKLSGLAALRIGYAIGPRGQISALRKLELPFPLGAPQLAAATAILDDPERLRRAGLLLLRERARVAQALRALGVAVSESTAPMLLLRDQKQPGRVLFALQAAGAAVHEAHWDAKAAVLALGRREENDRAVAAIRRAFTT